MSKVQQETDELIEFRCRLPQDVHSKIMTRKRKLAARLDKNVTIEAALVDLIRNPRSK